MKTIIINASPRKNMNTSQLMKEAQKGAESTGDTVEYIDLYDIVCTGCHSCMACKRKGIEEPCRCYWQDSLSPIVNRIYQSDRLIIGSSIFYDETTSQFRALLERVCFPAMSYNDYTSTFKRKVDVDVFLTMNVNKEYYDANYAEKFKKQFHPFRFLNGETHIHPCCDTMQVKDYSKYDMDAWDGQHKKQVHETQFTIDLEAAFKIGVGVQ